MTVTSLMGVSTKALFAAYAQVHTVGNNIANANTEGYSRQKVLQQNDMSLRTAAGYVGTGVSIVSVQRASNMFLTEQSQTLKSTAAADQVGNRMMGQLEQIFGSGEAGLGNAATQVFSAFADLTVNPSDLSARQAVLGRLEEFASLTRAQGSQLQLLQDNVRADISGAASEVNTIARQIAALNVQVQNATLQGITPNDLLDRRDVLVNHLAEQLDLQTFTTADGAMAVFVAGGQPLVLGSDANQLVVQRDNLDPSRTSVSMSIQGQLTLLADNHINGGKIGGLVDFQNDDLLAARNRLGQLVTAVAGTLNAQQSYGIDLYGNGGAPLFELAPPEALAAQTNARDASGNPIASVMLEITDVSALKASDYELYADPATPGQYTLTRLSDGFKRSNLNSGDEVDGLRFTDGANVPSTGERFLLRGVAQAPTALKLALRDAKGLAAAGPMVASLGAGNTGTVSVSGLDVVASPANPYQALTVRFTDDLGHYELRDAGDNTVGSGDFVPGQPLLYDGLALALTGVPKLGDSLRLNPTTFAGSNNGNALSFANLGQRLLVDGQQAGEAYASLFADVGVRAQGASIAADNSGGASARADAALSGEVGVNLDEEAARLIQFQQAYQAAAKVLQTAQTMIDTVLGLTR